MGFLDCPEGKESTCNEWDTGDTGLIPGLGRSSWRRLWKPTPVLLPEETNGQRNQWTEKSIESQRVGPNWSDLAHMHAYIYLYTHTRINIYLQCLRAGEDGKLRPRTKIKFTLFAFLSHSGPPVYWMMPSHMQECGFLYLVSWIKCNLYQKHPHSRHTKKCLTSYLGIL